MKSEVLVIEPGLYTSIQDDGRLGYRKFGVPVSGAMDALSASMANNLVGNQIHAALLEFTMVGPRLLFSFDAELSVSGASVEVFLNGNAVPMYQKIAVTAGSLLSFGTMQYGMRSYLAVKGGFDTPMVLGSRSMYSPVTDSPTIQRGDALPIARTDVGSCTDAVVMTHQHFNNKIFEVFEGPEYELLGNRHALFNRHYTIGAQSNRMAYRLDERLPNTLDDILTAAVAPGTIQLTPSGELVILMRDAQVTGGYPRILQLSEEAINRLAQKRPGEQVKFKLSDRLPQREL